MTTVTESPYAEMVRPSGKSGLGWTAVGVVVETTIETYGIETEETEIQVFVPAGTPNFNGCDTSGSKPQKCFDHYKTETVETSSWVSVDVFSTAMKVATGCFNPGGHNMGSHKHCEI
ncbi:MAG: hypothetical protein Q8L60_04680 [Gammaproteobacteria bacterium]|nr:hypothetical protein [Gammaproteobacteria bacterium]MDP2140693.1 hypothetical protein [Gammaproteobacteria bacterium]MDP2346949.1 hypothetical protein [Gammaproteobacteria bacterium]